MTWLIQGPAISPAFNLVKPVAKRLCRCRCSYSSQASPVHLPATSQLPSPRLNYRAISENQVSKSNNALNRKAPVPTNAISSIVRDYTESKDLMSALNSKRNIRSVIGERIRRCAEAKDTEGKNAALAEAMKVKEEISQLENALAIVEKNLLNLALALPNDTHPRSPLGPESAAVIISTHGPDPIPATPDRDHIAIGKKFGLFDFENASRVTGHAWYYLLNEAALLEIALTNYALSVAMKHGFTPVTTPDVVRLDIASRCGFQPRDHSDSPVSQMYHITPHTPSSPELILSGTSEIPLAGMFINRIYPASALPLKVVGIGRAFRAEAGARGTDTRGLYRVHQFTKVELFSVTAEEDSEKMMEEMKKIQRMIFESLGFPFRVLDMPTEELGASAYRKYDMEAWMPGRGSWGEISSLSNCTDYQSRRLHIRYRPDTSIPSLGSLSPPPTSGVVPFAHTLNGTAAAIPRLIIALLENGAIFSEDGALVKLHLPEILKPFWFGPHNSDSCVQWGSAT